MRLPESVTIVLLDAGADVVWLSMCTAGDADRPGPGEPDFDLPSGLLVEFCRSLPFDALIKPVELLYTDDMERGFPVASILPP